MGSSTSKIECIWLPGQSGKTKKITEMMKDKIKEYKCFGDITGIKGGLNIIVCSNNRSLVRQTGSRMEKDGPQIDGSIFSWFSGDKTSNISSKELADDIKEGVVDMVICCSNKTRLQYLVELVKNLQRSSHFDKEIHIWIDEADASVNLWSQDEFVDILGFEKVKKVVLVSATFDSVLKKYDRIKVLPIKNTTNLETYHSIQDCNIVEDDTLTNNAPEYIEAIYAKYRDVLKKPGMRLFAPGDIERKTHDRIAEFLLSEGFAVAVLNGTRKEIVIPGKASIDLTRHIDFENVEDEEIGKKIAKFYHEKNLSKNPFAITGQLCLGRGLTFQNEHFLFDFGILSYISDRADAYQCACRMAGNIRKYTGYKQSTIVTSSLMHKVIVHQEEIAKNIARLVYENSLQDVGKEEVAYAAGKRKDYGKADVPIVVQLDEKRVKRLQEMTTDKRKVKALHYFQKYLTRNGEDELAKRLDNYDRNKVSFPGIDGSEQSYKEHITNIVKMAQENKTSTKDFPKNKIQENVNMWNCFVDLREYRLVFLVYHGATPKPLGGWKAHNSNIFDSFDTTGAGSVSTTSTNPFDD